MVGRVDEVIAELKANPPPVPVDDIAEAIQFLEWLAADNFTLLGVRDYALDRQGAAISSRCRQTGLGVLRGDDVPVLTRGGQVVSITPQLRAFFDEPKTLIVTKANVKSRVHRRVYLDYIGVKRFDRRRQADRRVPHRRPVHFDRLHPLDRARSRICAARPTPCCARAGFDPDSHSGKALVNVLETYPRDELFQIDEDTLYRLRAQHPAARGAPARARAGAARPLRPLRVGAGLRAARALRAAQVRAQIGDYLAEVFKGRVSAFYPFIHGRAAHARAFHHRPRRRTRRPTPIAPRWRTAVGAIVRTWTDALGRGAGRRRTSRAGPRALFARYRRRLLRRLSRRLFAGRWRSTTSA